MFKEFAVDPSAVVRSDRDLVYVLEKFGMHHGRMISEFPRRWKAMAYEAAKQRHGGKVELTRITEHLNHVRDGVLLASGRPGGDPALGWITRAAIEHARQPFDAIVSEEPPAGRPFVSFDQFDEGHPCLAPNRQWSVRRDAQSLAATCTLHLKTAKSVKLVDPHFDLSRRRYRRPFEAMLDAAGENRPRFDIYRNDAHEVNEAIRRVDRSAREAARRGFEVRLYLRPEATMHNRFVLTERGGVMFGTGLDDDDDGNGTHSDEVTLLDPLVWEQRWAEFADDAPVARWERGAI
jgi:hypothetical protein